MPTRCTSHAISVGEYIEYFRAYRTYYRALYKADPLAESKVSALIVKEMDRLGIIGPCCRQMVLNVDTREDFYARREAYSTMAQAPTTVTSQLPAPSPILPQSAPPAK